MEIRYAPGESPAEIDAQFARCTAAGEIILAVVTDADTDALLSNVFARFCREPEARDKIEAGLLRQARRALETNTRAALAEIGDEVGDAAEVAIGVADRLNLGSDAHRLAGRWLFAVLRENAAKSRAGDDLAAAAAALEAAAKALDAAVGELRNATRH